VASLVFPEDARCPDESASTRPRLNASGADSDAPVNVEASPAAVLDDTYAATTQPGDLDAVYNWLSPNTNTSTNTLHSLPIDVVLPWSRTRASLSGLIRAPPLPHFPTCWQSAMATSKQYQIPQTPRVISPSPTPSEAGSAKDGYFGPVTRASARKNRQPVQSPPPIDEDSSGSDPDKRARARSRSPILVGGTGRRRMSGLTSRRQRNGVSTKANSTVNGHLSPAAANKNYWREMSRSPSPLGLIPIHQEWRSFVGPSHRSSSPHTNAARSTATKSRARSSMFPSAS
jgi:hypothetical protein